MRLQYQWLKNYEIKKCFFRKESYHQLTYNSLWVWIWLPHRLSKTSITVNNSPIQNYTHPDESIPPTYEITPGFNLFTVNVSQFNMFYRIAIFSLFLFFSILKSTHMPYSISRKHGLPSCRNWNQIWRNSSPMQFLPVFTKCIFLRWKWPISCSGHRRRTLPVRPRRSRLQNSRFFFSKSVKKSIKCGVRVLRTRSARVSHAHRAFVPSLALCFQPRSRLLFDCSRVLEDAKIRTVLQSIVEGISEISSRG